MLVSDPVADVVAVSVSDADELLLGDSLLLCVCVTVVVSLADAEVDALVLSL